MRHFDFLSSERLVYCPLGMEDLETYVRFRNEKSYRKWFYFQDAPTISTATKEIEIMSEKSNRQVNLLKESFDSGLYLKETGELVGTISLNKFHGPEKELDYVEIGFGIGEVYQGNGYATEATKTVVAWGLKRLLELSAEPKIEGNVEHENWPSRRVLEKTGFTFIRADKYLSIYEIHESSFT